MVARTMVIIDTLLCRRSWFVPHPSQIHGVLFTTKVVMVARTTLLIGIILCRKSWFLPHLSQIDGVLFTTNNHDPNSRKHQIPTTAFILWQLSA